LFTEPSHIILLLKWEQHLRWFVATRRKSRLRATGQASKAISWQALGSIGIGMIAAGKGLLDLLPEEGYG
jgi:hypothetical protein